MSFWEKLALAAVRGALKEGEKELNKAVAKLEKQEQETSKPEHIDVEVINSKKV